MFEKQGQQRRQIRRGQRGSLSRSSVVNNNYGLSSMSLSLLLLLFLCYNINTFVESKIVEGKFRLSGVNTEFTFSNFAVGKDCNAQIDISLWTNPGTTKTYPMNGQNLKFHMFIDNDWSKVSSAMTCGEKVNIITTSKFKNPPRHKFEFKYNNEEKSWKASIRAQLSRNDYAAVIQSERPHFWYFLIDDCSLEQYLQDDLVPELNFKFEAKNINYRAMQEAKKTKKMKKAWGTASGITHFSAEEFILIPLHYITFIVSGIIVFYLQICIVGNLYKTKIVHVSKFIVLVASALDAISSLLETIHYHRYKYDGRGSFMSHLLSSQTEALCDALITILLISISAGWTLPSDVIKVKDNQLQNINASFIQSFVSSLLYSNGSVTILSIIVIVIHLGLALWGRIYYHDAYDSYHDLEHLPGKILMMLRQVFGFFLLIAIIQTKAKCYNRNRITLLSFYNYFGFTGFLWFISLPIITFVVNWRVPYVYRHTTVIISTSILQCSFLALLAWLVTSTAASSFHQVSHINTTKNDFKETTFTETITSSAAATATTTSNSSMSQKSSLEGKATNPTKRTNVLTLGKTKVRLD